MQSKFTIIRNSRQKMAWAKTRQSDRSREMVIKRIELQAGQPFIPEKFFQVGTTTTLPPSSPPVVWWNPKTWRL